ncbi:hypothetical protein ABZ891_18080 [Streptomyces sp. NPDC047023]|uniref:hypothetical protein n=1 Tax=Streptomyces sp. NPDC047023 TaxID=3155139 RepID=UPI003401C66E
MIAVTLLYPDAPNGAAHRHGHDLGCTGRGWLRCEITAIPGAWQPPYTMLTQAAANLPLPDGIGLDHAHYAVRVEAGGPDGSGYTLLRLGPYSQTWLASRDADQLTTELAGHAATAIPGYPVTAQDTAFSVSDHASYTDPYGADVTALLAGVLTR